MIFREEELSYTFHGCEWLEMGCSFPVQYTWNACFFFCLSIGSSKCMEWLLMDDEPSFIHVEQSGAEGNRALVQNLVCMCSRRTTPRRLALKGVICF